MNTSSVLRYPIYVDETNQSGTDFYVSNEKCETDEKEFLRFFHCMPQTGAQQKQLKISLSDVELYKENLLNAKDNEFDGKCDDVLLSIRNKCGGNVFVAKSIISTLIVNTYKNDDQCERDLSVIDLCECFQTIANCTDIVETKSLLIDHILSIRETKCNSNRYSCLVENVMRYIDDHYAEGLTTKKVAEQFKISPSYLCNILRKETGETFIKLLTKARLRQAKRLLKNPTMRICEISEAVGYSDYIYFYKLFKKSEGCAPRSFRNQN